MNNKSLTFAAILLASSTIAFSARVVSITIRNGSGYQKIDKVIFTQINPETGEESTLEFKNIINPVTKKIRQTKDEYIYSIEVKAGNDENKSYVDQYDLYRWSGDKKFVINTDLSVSESNI